MLTIHGLPTNVRHFHKERLKILNVFDAEIYFRLLIDFLLVLD